MPSRQESLMAAVVVYTDANWKAQGPETQVHRKSLRAVRFKLS